MINKQKYWAIIHQITVFHHWLTADAALVAGRWLWLVTGDNYRAPLVGEMVSFAHDSARHLKRSRSQGDLVVVVGYCWLVFGIVQDCSVLASCYERLWTGMKKTTMPQTIIQPSSTMVDMVIHVDMVKPCHAYDLWITIRWITII